MEKHWVSCVCYLKNTFRARLPSKRHRHLLHQHHLQSHVHCGNDPTVANHKGILSTVNARNTGEIPFTLCNQSEHDPRMIRLHTRPSRNCRTAEVDHRGSGTEFVWNNIGFVHLLSLKNAFRARLPPKLHRQDLPLRCDRCERVSCVVGLFSDCVPIGSVL